MPGAVVHTRSGRSSWRPRLMPPQTPGIPTSYTSMSEAYRLRQLTILCLNNNSLLFGEWSLNRPNVRSTWAFC